MKNRKNQILLLSAGSYSFIWMIGIWLNIRGIILPDLIDTFHLSYSASGLVFLITLIPSQAGNLTAGFFIKKVPLKILMSTACLIIAGLTISLSLSPTYPIFLFFMFISGFFTNIMLVSANTIIPNMYSGDLQHKREGALVLLHLFYAIGSITAALFGSEYLIRLLSGPKKTSLLQIIGWRNIYIIVAAALIVPIIFYLLADHSVAKGKQTTFSIKDYLQYLKNKKLLLFSCAAACYNGAEFILSGWLFTYLEKGFELSKNQASLHLMFFFISLLLGRIAGVRLIRFFKAELFAAAGAVLGAITLITGILFGQHYLISLTGLFYAPLFPLLQSMGITNTRGNDNSIKTTIIFVFSALGATIFPYLTGLIGDLAGNFSDSMILGIRTGYSFSALLMIPIIIFIYLGNRHE